MKNVWILFFDDQAAQKQKNPDYPNLLCKELKEKAHSVEDIKVQRLWHKY